MNPRIIFVIIAIIVGGIITATVDQIMGIEFTNSFTAIIHKAIYMGNGAIIMAIMYFPASRTVKKEAPMQTIET